ncbi:MAG: TonB-dependent receptor, partial [Candidatus Competibacteraceae bacterium]|nr:TonB-dependent receptor [Candidatus Competibacteraceae bacterium]
TTDNVLAKLIYEPSETHRLAFTLDHFQGDTDSELLSSIGTSSRGVSIEDESAHDERERTRYSVDYRLRTDTPVFDQLQFKLYRQDSQTDQQTRQLQRLTDGSLTRRSRDSSFEQNVQGTSVQLDKDILIGTVSHHLVYGGEAYTIDGDNYRYGSTVDVLTGEPVDDSAGAPTRAFPLSETTNYAAFVQDEITLADGRLTLTPGLRFDYFELDASSDPVYESGNPGIASPEDF